MSWKAEKAVDAEGIINCLGHGKEAVFRTSRTAANPDRDFYACDVKPSCNFFIWADDPHLIKVMNARAAIPPIAEKFQTIGRAPSSSLPNAAHLSTPTKNSKAFSSSLPTPTKSSKKNARRDPSPDWPDDLVEEEDEWEAERERKGKEALIREVEREEDEIVDDAGWDTDGEQALQAGKNPGGRFKFREAKEKGKKRARDQVDEDEEDDGSGDYHATKMEERRKAIEENMKRMRAEQNLPPQPSSPTKSTITPSSSSSYKSLQTPPTSPIKPPPPSLTSLADKKTIDFLRSQNAKLRDERTALAEDVKRVEGEYAELVDEVIGLKAEKADWEEEREGWVRRVEVLEGGRRVGN